MRKEHCSGQESETANMTTRSPGGKAGRDSSRHPRDRWIEARATGRAEQISLRAENETGKGGGRGKATGLWRVQASVM